MLRDTVAAFRDRSFLFFAALAFVFPLSMGLVVTASPIYAADAGLGEGYIGLVLGGNSLIVAAAAVPIAARVEPLGPFRLLGAAAFVVACGIACYALVPGGVQLRGARRGRAACARAAARRLPGRLDADRFFQHGQRAFLQRAAERSDRLARRLARVRRAHRRGGAPSLPPSPEVCADRDWRKLTRSSISGSVSLSGLRMRSPSE